MDVRFPSDLKLLPDGFAGRSCDTFSSLLHSYVSALRPGMDSMTGQPQSNLIISIVWSMDFILLPPDDLKLISLLAHLNSNRRPQCDC